jgi:purine-binding chemotaxis protein CheW
MSEMDFNSAAEDTLHGKYLTFLLDQECYGLEISYITDIIQMQPIATLPEVKHYVKGIINLRGEIIPVMDVRLRFGKPEIAYTERTCVIVARTGLLCVGLIVDSVCEVIQIPDESISQPPRSTAAANRFIQVHRQGGPGDQAASGTLKSWSPTTEIESVARMETAYQEAAINA